MGGELGIYLRGILILVRVYSLKRKLQTQKRWGLVLASWQAIVVKDKSYYLGVKTQMICVTSLSAFIKTMIVLLRLPLFMV